MDRKEGPQNSAWPQGATPRPWPARRTEHDPRARRDAETPAGFCHSRLPCDARTLLVDFDLFELRVILSAVSGHPGPNAVDADTIIRLLHSNKAAERNLRKLNGHLE